MRVNWAKSRDSKVVPKNVKRASMSSLAVNDMFKSAAIWHKEATRTCVTFSRFGDILHRLIQRWETDDLSMAPEHIDGASPCVFRDFNVLQNLA